MQSEKTEVRVDQAAIERLGAAIEQALDEASVSDVLSILTGAFVGLTVEMVRRLGHDLSLPIKVDGGPNRDITIHAPKTEFHTDQESSDIVPRRSEETKGGVRGMPNRLCLRDGVLAMQDGSNVVDYLRSRPIKDTDEVVILTREAAERLAADAHAYRMSLLVGDERFALAA